MTPYPFTLHELEQRSDEWRSIRVGRLTASRAHDMLATIKTGESAARRKLRTQLVIERLTGKSAEREYQSNAMRYGIEQEEAARLAYEILTGRLLESVGFCSHHELLAGCSLDGYCDDFTGIIEVKCPESHTHYEYLKTGKVPRDYLAQITHALWITGAEWCDWLSYDDAWPEQYRAKLVRVLRADVNIVSYETAARAFLEEVDREVAALKGWSVLQEAGA